MDIIAHIKREKMKAKFMDATIFEDKTKEKVLPKKTSSQQDRVVGSW